MKYLKFYQDEDLRHPELAGITISPKRARFAAIKLESHYKTMGRVKVTFLESPVYSYGDKKGVHLAYGADWLTFLHEFAHVLEIRWHGTTRHGRRLRKIIDSLCAHVLREGWHEIDMQEQFEAHIALAAEIDRQAREMTRGSATVFDKALEQVARLAEDGSQS